MTHQIKNISADIHFQMKWNSAEAIHIEEYEAYNVNFWRDCLPKELYKELESKSVGETVQIDFAPGSIVPGYEPRKILKSKGHKGHNLIAHLFRIKKSNSVKYLADPVTVFKEIGRVLRPGGLFMDGH